MTDDFDDPTDVDETAVSARDELASGYLDGELTADEVVRAQADSEVLGIAADMDEMRNALLDVEPAAISRREEQLATALGVWDRLPESERLGGPRAVPDGTDPGVAAAASSVTSTEQRRQERWFRSPRLLAGAAALVIFLGGAAIVLRQDDEPNDDSFATESADTVAPADTEPAELDVDSAPAAENLAAQDLEAETETLEDAADEGIDVSNASPSAGVDELGPPSDTDTTELARLDGVDDLADFAAPAVDAPDSDDALEDATGVVVDDGPDQLEQAADSDADLEVSEEAGESPESATAQAPIEPAVCDGLGVDIVVGPAAYVGHGPVVVGIDRSRDVAIAYDPVTCALVQTAPLP